MNGFVTLSQARAAVGLPARPFASERLGLGELRALPKPQPRPTLPLVPQRCIHCQRQWTATPFPGQLAVRCPGCGEPTPVRRGPQP